MKEPSAADRSESSVSANDFPMSHAIERDRGLRVGIVGPIPPPAGGMATQSLQLRELLTGDGACVTFVATNAPYRPAWISRWKGIRAIFRLVPYVANLWRCAGGVDVLHVMANSRWSWHLHAAPAVWIGHLRHCRVVVNYRGGEAESFLSSAAAVVRPTLARADVVAVPSRFLQEVFARHGVESIVLPNIIDRRRFHPADEPAAHGRADLLICRNLEPIYDIGTAIRALAIVHRTAPDATLTIAGSGPQREQLVRQAAEAGLAASVRFVGRLDRDEIAALNRKSGIVVNPSLVDNMPNSILEALASGTPVVSTNVGGVRHLVTDERTALLVPPGDPEALAAAILRLIGDDALVARLRAEGLSEVEQYTWGNVRERLYRLYRSTRSAPAITEEVA
jgi:glycosyltransferase involved in cell wall biosynthesis